MTPEEILEQYGYKNDGLTVLFSVFVSEAEEAEYNRKNNIWDFVEHVLKESDEVLTKAGFPAVGFVIAHSQDGRIWEYLSSDPDAQSEQLLTLPFIAKSSEFVVDQSDAFSREYYAASQGSLCLQLLGELAENPSSARIAEYAYLLGRSVTDQEWRFRHKAEILTGQRTVRNLDQARRSSIRSGKGRAENRRAIVAEIAGATVLTGGALENRILRLLNAEHRITVTARTIRNDLKIISDRQKVGNRR